MMNLLLLIGLPFFYLSILPDRFDFPKQAIIILSAFFLIIAKAVFALKNSATKDPKIDFTLPSTDKFLLLFLVSLWLSFFVNINSKFYFLNLISIFGPVTFTALIILYFCSKEETYKSYKTYMIFLVSGSIFALFVILQQLNLTSYLLPLKSYFPTPFSSPLGSFSNVIVFLGIALVFSGEILWQKIKNIKLITLITLIKLIAYGLPFVLIFSAFFYSLYAYFFLPNHLLFFSQGEGWIVTSGALANPKTALFGVGPGNFSLAFAHFRPLSLSSMALSQIVFNANSNLYFHLLTEYGLLSLGLFLLWLYKSYKNYFFLFFLLLFAFFPPSLIGLLFFFLLAKSFGSSQRETINLRVNTPLPFWGFLTIFLILLLSLSYFSYIYGRYFLAEVYFKKAIDSQTKIITLNTYQYINKAINLYQDSPASHSFLSQISFSSSQDLLSKKDLNDEDKNNLKNLLSQAVNEAQTSIRLRPEAVYYSNLSQIYNYFAAIIQNTQNFSLNNAGLAVSSDPNNPLYHFLLGSVFLRQKQWSPAQRQFELTASLDPSYINAFYNLYFVLREEGQYQNALAYLSQVKNFLGQKHPQFSQIETEYGLLNNVVNDATQSGKLLSPQEVDTLINPSSSTSTPSGHFQPSSPKIGL